MFLIMQQIQTLQIYNKKLNYAKKSEFMYYYFAKLTKKQYFCDKIINHCFNALHTNICIL